jgi:hypothetical protein
MKKTRVRERRSGDVFQFIDSDGKDEDEVIILDVGSFSSSLLAAIVSIVFSFDFV